MRAFLLSAVFVLLAGADGIAQEPKPDAAEQPAIRYELMQRLKRFETAWEKDTTAEARRLAIRHLEKFPQQLRNSEYAEASRSLDRAGFELVSENEPGVARQWTWSLFAVPETRLVDGSAKELAVTIKPLYSVKGDVPKDLEIQLWFTDKNITKINPKEFPHTVKVPLPPLGEFKGLDRKLNFMVETNKEMRHTAIVISQVADLETRLAALKKCVGAFEAVDTIEKATARNRSELLANLARGTGPEIDLPAANLLANAEEMLDDKAFYTAAKTGQFWLSVPTEKKSTPVRVFVPRGLDEKKPVPIVVALPGAGGSENLFFEGYGNGRIVTECRKRGWILVSPRDASAVMEILDQLATRYPIDKKRAFIVGHAAGASQAMELVRKYSGKFAAVAALAGGSASDTKAFTELPVFIGVGGKDKLSLTVTRELKKSLGDVKKLTYKEYPDIEHLVIVREALPDVFALFEDVATLK